MKPKDLRNPYADYRVDDLYQFLSGYTLPRDPGSEFEYSNLGGGCSTTSSRIGPERIMRARGL
jgi:hypothetical protein